MSGNDEQFNPGDRVRYIGTFSKSMSEEEGIVISTERKSSIRVKWDNPKHNGTLGYYGVYPYNIVRIDNDYKEDQPCIDDEDI